MTNLQTNFYICKLSTIESTSLCGGSFFTYLCNFNMLLIKSWYKHCTTLKTTSLKKTFKIAALLVTTCRFC